MAHGLPQDQPISPSIHPTSDARLAEFREQRFGLFIYGVFDPTLQLPMQRPDVAVPVIELFL
ncbi:hypothetical protein [Nonomuraea sp. NPDC049695]|uniref:hypothetical protein n=1 Tax=Nonomuraea sp. NPDC049695 TaxID=3154734 RepID=UPI003442ACDC